MSKKKPDVSKVKSIIGEMKILPYDQIDSIFDICLFHMLSVYNSPVSNDSPDELARVCALSLKPYVNAFGKLSSKDLDAGWQRLMEEYSKTTWPTCREILSSCAVATGASVKSVRSGDRRSYKEIVAIKRRLSREYWEWYQKTDEWKSAVEKGYSAECIKFIGFRIEEQARILASSTGKELVTTDVVAKRRLYFLDEMEREGRISVTIPDEKIREWEAACARS